MRVHRFFRYALALIGLAALPGFAQTRKTRASLPTRTEENARILHALNRLTFGPRPGEIAEVRETGLHAWIEQQLHPESIDDSALDARLKRYPALSMSVQELVRQLPPPPLIRQIAQGKATMPTEEPLRAVYETQLALLDTRQEKKPDPQADDVSSQERKRAPAAGSGLDAQKRQILADLDATRVVNLPPQRIERILAMQPAARVQFFKDLSGEERLALFEGLTPEQAQWVAGMRNPVRTIASQLEAAKMLRVTESRRQLQQVMTDFWLNHFNVDIRKSPLMPYYLTEYERDVIAPNALGHFEDLLVAVAHSPAMLLYLDNESSVGPHSETALQAARRNSLGTGTRPVPGLNENYGRELMELHTLGVNGGYTQQDVIEVAKAFTGWTIDAPLQGGGFVFNPRRHEPGPKHVLGYTIEEHGEDEGLEVLHILATRPATAHKISEELAERFVSDHPSPVLVNSMARTFLKTHADIRAVLRTMIFSPQFQAPAVRGAKTKTPLELVASAVRASGTEVRYPGVLAAAVGRLGMPLYDCQPPTGYSTLADHWVSSGALVERMNFAVAFAENRLPGVTNHWDALLGADAAGLTPEQKEARLEAILLPGAVSASTHAAVLEELAKTGGVLPAGFPVGNGGEGYLDPADISFKEQGKATSPPDWSAATMAGLLIGSPEFQTH